MLTLHHFQIAQLLTITTPKCNAVVDDVMMTFMCHNVVGLFVYPMKTSKVESRCMGSFRFRYFIHFNLKHSSKEDFIHRMI